LKKLVKFVDGFDLVEHLFANQITSIDTTNKDFQASRTRYEDRKYWGITFRSKQFLSHPVLSPHDGPIPGHVPTPRFRHPSSARLSVPSSTQPEAILLQYQTTQVGSLGERTVCRRSSICFQRQPHRHLAKVQVRYIAQFPSCNTLPNGNYPPNGCAPPYLPTVLLIQRVTTLFLVITRYRSHPALKTQTFHHPMTFFSSALSITSTEVPTPTTPLNLPVLVFI
jgi:hypothetical protein